MEFLEAMPVAFKEIAPNHNIPEKWKEVVLNTGALYIIIIHILLKTTNKRNLNQLIFF